MHQLSCKLEREFRCVELAEMMTQSVVPLAIRYASRSRRMLLAQRLNELALEKASQLEEEAEPEEEPAYHSQAQNARYSENGGWLFPRSAMCKFFLDCQIGCS